MNDTPKTTEKRTPRRFHGVVVSDKMDKTIVVRVDRSKVHPKYLKRYHRSTTFKVHDPENAYHTGDKVEFVETRPLSREKRWRVITPKAQA